MAGFSRRDALRTGAVLSCGLSAAVVTAPSTARAEISPSERSFQDDYYDGALKILTGLRDTQVSVIEREMRTAFEREKKGGKIYSQITAGHFPTDETALTRIGQPGVFAFMERNAKDEDYAKLRSDDMIITDVIHLGNIKAMRRGIRVVGVTVNYYPFAQTPAGEGYQIEFEGKLVHMEDASTVLIDSQTPWCNGLVRTAQNPDFPVLPGGGISQAAVYWMAAAELAGLKAGKGKEAGGWAKQYIETCIDRAQMVRQDREKFLAAGKRLADLVIRGGRWWVAGEKAMVSDASGVATGPMVTRPYRADQVKKDDIVLICAYSSNNPDDLAIARDSVKKGAFVAAITPFATDSDASGARLYKEVDIAFNNYSPDSWGVVPVKGLDRRACPATGVIGDLVLWLLMAEWTDVMARRDLFPYFWKGIFMKNGTEYNNQVRPLFEARGW